MVYQGPAGVATSVATVVAATQQQQQPPQPQPPPPPPPPQSATPSKGKKRKAGNKENQILTESVDDLPCTPDDEDINTPYPCEHCNKTIKGRVMLQAHHYQEHYDNPELNGMALGDKHACRVCLKLFTRNSDVKAHILRVHCGDRRYPCTMCGKRFKESTHLRKHLYTHTGKATFSSLKVSVTEIDVVFCRRASPLLHAVQQRLPDVFGSQATQTHSRPSGESGAIQLW